MEDVQFKRLEKLVRQNHKKLTVLQLYEAIRFNENLIDQCNIRIRILKELINARQGTDKTDVKLRQFPE